MQHSEIVDTAPATGGLRICKNCRHSALPPARTGMLCTHPDHGVDLVYGLPISPVCELLRRQRDDWCGLDGHHFEERPASAGVAQPGIDTVANGAQGV